MPWAAFLCQGFCSRAQTPTERGFDSFFGFYLDQQDHFSHVGKDGWYDFRFNLALDTSVRGQYSTDIYSDRVRRIIREYHVRERDRERERERERRSVRGGGEETG